MLTRDEATARVAKGAAFLDIHQPGWAQRIEPGRLQMFDGDDCIIGQLYGDFEIWVDEHVDDDFDDVAHGFHVGDHCLTWGIFCIRLCKTCMADYTLLQDAWVAAMADRLVVSDGRPDRAPVDAGGGREPVPVAVHSV